MPCRRSDNASRAASRAKAVSLGAGGSDKVVCAISEGRGSATVVGLCFLIVGTSECIICNIVDSQTYIRTLQKLDVFDPTEILMPIASCGIGSTQPSSGGGAGKSKLCMLIERYFPGAKLVPTNRKEYNASLGIECLTKWTAPEEVEGLSFELSSKYYTACAAAAAIQYTQRKYHINYTTNSVRIKFQASEDSMALNSITIKSLELVHNSLEATRGMSLYKLMNKTHTAMGARMLRSCILQPLTNVETLTSRQDAVKELYEEALIFSQITKSNFFFCLPMFYTCKPNVLIKL
jgi:DNA mismatch repair protein MSH4